MDQHCLEAYSFVIIQGMGGWGGGGGSGPSVPPFGSANASQLFSVNFELSSQTLVNNNIPEWPN